jgi:hypothetical protein
MRKIFSYLSILLLATTLFSCQKVIQLDLKEMKQKYVIEGFITEGESSHQVRITKTLNFDQSMAYPTVDNAVVVVTDNIGNTATFAFLTSGIYETNGFLGVSGRKYTITITIDGEVFTAESSMPTVSTLDSLELAEIPFGAQSFITVIPKFQDELNVENFYFFNVFINGEKASGITVRDDKNFEGQSNQQPLFDFVESTDTVNVVLHCIDKAAYKYLFSIGANTGSIASPANPDSNFGNKCLGYFSARVTSEKTIVVP